ncbi:Phosphoglycerate mutase family protein [gamma proteobacterium HdN1]|nr:Phosphoglycerate mutase family protein [gamma proteobacterium HdN1]
MGTIHLIRHGQASFGKANYDKLSELGIEQSVQLGRHYAQAGVQFSKIACGEMLRHQETMEHCLQGMAEVRDPNNAITPILSKAFNEFDHEQVVARYQPEFADKAALAAWLARQTSPAAAFQSLFDQAMQRWLSGNHDDDYSESWLAFRARTLAGFEALREQSGASEHIAVFTSGGPISVITQQLLGIPDQHVLKLNYALINASITRVFYNREHANLSSFNSYAHLETFGNHKLITYR